MTDKTVFTSGPPPEGSDIYTLLGLVEKDTKMSKQDDQSSDSRRSMQEIIGLLYEIRDNTKEHMLPPGTMRTLQIGSTSAYVLYTTRADHVAELRFEVRNTGLFISLIIDGGLVLWSTLVHWHPDDIVAMNAAGQWR